MRVLGKQVEELVAEGRQGCAGADAGMIVEKEDELAERRELVGERLGELRETPLQTAAAIEERGELLAERGRVAPQSADEVGEENEWVLVTALQGQPGRAPAGCAEEVGVLGEYGGLAVAGGRVHKGQPMTAGAFEAIEQSLPPEERER